MAAVVSHFLNCAVSDVGDIPIVDVTVWITGGEYLDVAIWGSHVRLRVVDIVLMDSVLSLHTDVVCQLKAIVEES